METGLLHDYFGTFCTQSEKYYFCTEESMRGEIESTCGGIEMNIPVGGYSVPARWG